MKRKKQEDLYRLHAAYDPSPAFPYQGKLLHAEPYTWDGKHAEQTYPVGPLRLIFYSGPSMAIVVEKEKKLLDLGRDFTTSASEVFAGVERLSSLSVFHDPQIDGSEPLPEGVEEQIQALFQEYFGYPWNWLSIRFERDMGEAVRLLKRAEELSL